MVESCDPLSVLLGFIEHEILSKMKEQIYVYTHIYMPRNEYLKCIKNYGSE